MSKQSHAGGTENSVTAHIIQAGQYYAPYVQAPAAESATDFRRGSGREEQVVDFQTGGGSVVHGYDEGYSSRNSPGRLRS